MHLSSYIHLINNIRKIKTNSVGFCLFLFCSLLIVLSVLPSIALANKDLLTDANIRIDGVAGGDGESLGYSVSNAGDVNNDGKADVIIGANDADYNNRVNSGSVYIVYGS